MSALLISLKSDSRFLREHTTFEVRNARMELVESWDVGDDRIIELEPGLYQVSAVLSDGLSHERLVRLAEDGAEVEFWDTAYPPAETPPEWVSGWTGDPRLYLWRKVNVGQRPFKMPINFDRHRVTQTGPSWDDDGVDLVEVVNARHGRSSYDAWIFEPVTDQQIPTASFAVKGESFTMSLPTNPCGEFPLNACIVEFGYKKGRFLPMTWIAPERTVANTLQHLLLQGRVSKARDLASDAMELLLSKYNDPTGALLGALVLVRFGLLEDQRASIDNLARNFDWLTDASILQLIMKAHEQGADLDLVEQAGSLAKRPVLFTESYSLLIDLLRRWPGKGADEKAFADRCRQLLGELAARTVNVDWSATVLTTVKPQLLEDEVVIHAAS